MSIKQKTISGLLWSSIDSFSSMAIQFIVGIILARILSPSEFGLIGMVAIFIAVSQSFINSGFSSALIRKKDCSQADYSTVFFFNLVAGILFFLLMIILAPAISRFFNEPELKAIVRILSVVLIIDSLTIIQRTILTRRIDFKLQTKISLIASTGSGIIAIVMAYKGMGVWSLVAQRLISQALNSIMLWAWNQWRPDLLFSKSSFRELFGFGSKLLISGLIDTIYNNVYQLVIGKYFSAQDLGYYTRAYQFRSLPTEYFTGIVMRVSYPVMAQIQDNKERLKNAYKRMIRSTMFVTFLLVLGLAAVAEPMIITLIGEKWRPSVVFLQLLCFSGMLYPLQAINLNMLNVMGRSDLFLKLEVIKKSLAIPTIVIGVYFGIKIMLTLMILNSFISCYLNSYWSGKFIDYSIKEQLKDIAPSFTLASVMALLVFSLGFLLDTSSLLTLIIQLLAGFLFVILVGELLRMPDYIYLKQILSEKLIRKT